MLKPTNRIIETDKYWDADVSGENLSNRVFQRVSAKDRRFTKVDFRYCVFDGCYLRKSKFDSCDFTGCRFVATNMRGSTFSGCKFEYASFERTLIANDILDTCCPGHENEKLGFAMALRTNYQSLGDSDSVNKAILVELDATRVHWYKAWRSNESYYRKKYSGLSRWRAFLIWSKFRLLDFAWGNGESISKLFWSVVLSLVLLAILDTIFYRDPRLVSNFVQAFLDSPQIFLGTKQSLYPGLVVSGITLLRLTVLALFMSILIRRFAHR